MWNMQQVNDPKRSANTAKGFSSGIKMWKGSDLFQYFCSLKSYCDLIPHVSLMIRLMSSRTFNTFKANICSPFISPYSDQSQQSSFN